MNPASSPAILGRAGKFFPEKGGDFLRRGESLLNTISAGFGGVVTDHLDSELKAKLGPFAFLLGVRDALSELVSYRASVVLDERETHHAAVAGIVVANGATIAGGLRIAPGARANDGMLDVVMLEYAELWTLAALAARVAAGEISGSDSVRLFAASRVRITSEPAMPFSLDGELLDAPPHAVEL